MTTQAHVHCYFLETQHAIVATVLNVFEKAIYPE